MGKCISVQKPKGKNASDQQKNKEKETSKNPAKQPKQETKPDGLIKESETISSNLQNGGCSSKSSNSQLSISQKLKEAKEEEEKKKNPPENLFVEEEKKKFSLEQDFQLYYINKEENQNLTKTEVSSSEEYDSIINQIQEKKEKVLYDRLLNLPQRNWLGELIQLSEQLKNNQAQINDMFLLKYYNTIMKLHSHFHYLIKAFEYYYTKGQYSMKVNEFETENFGNPEKGFVYKGVYVKLYSFDEAREVKKEVSAMEYVLLEYFQALEDKRRKIPASFFDAVFPMIGYCQLYDKVLVVSGCIDTLEDSKAEHYFSDYDESSDEFSEDFVLLKNLNKDNILKVYNAIDYKKKKQMKVKYMVINSRKIIPSIVNNENIYEYNFTTNGTAIKEFVDPDCEEIKGGIQVSKCGINFKVFLSKDQRSNENKNFVENLLLQEQEILGKRCEKMLYSLSPIKQKYPILTNTNIKNIFFHFQNLILSLNRVRNQIYSLSALKNIFYRNGLNSFFLYFSLFNIPDNTSLSTLVKLSIFLSIVKKCIFSISPTSHKCFSKPTSQNQKEKIFYTLKSILFPEQAPKLNFQSFLEELYSKILSFTNLYIFKMKIIDDWFHLGIFTGKVDNEKFNDILDVKKFFQNLVSNAQSNPFLFIKCLMEKMNCRINPFTTFKASISLDNIENTLGCEDIEVNPTQIRTYVSFRNLSYFIIAKKITLSNRFKDSKIELGIKPNITSSKLGKSNFEHNSSKQFSQKKEELDIETDFEEYIIDFPPILYCLRTNKPKQSLLSNRYKLQSLQTIVELSSNIKSLLSDISIPNKYEMEKIYFEIFVYEFIYYFLIKKDYQTMKSRIENIKVPLKRSLISLEYASIIYLVEGMCNGSYINSEEFYSKSLICTILCFGEPRGRNSISNPFILYPLWAVSRKIFKLEKNDTYQQFKEMFLCAEYFSKQFKKSFQLFVDFFANQRNFLLTNIKVTESIQILEEEIDERPSLVNSKSEICIVSEEITHPENNDKIYNFPDITESKTLDKEFTSKEFSLFLIRQILALLRTDNPVLYEVNSLLSERADKGLRDKPKGSVLSNYIYNVLTNEIGFKTNSSNNILVGFGNNAHSEIGNEGDDKFYYPFLVYKLKDMNIDDVSCGWEHTVVLSRGNAYTFGHNQSLQCGKESNEIVSNPNKIKLNTQNNAESFYVTKAACGNEYTLFLTKTGEVYGVGSNEDSVIGLEDRNKKVSEPVKIEFPKDVKISSIACGTVHNLALSNEGKVYTWGSGQGGQLGLEKDTVISLPNACTRKPTLTEVIKEAKIKQIAAGEAHSIALDTQGQCYVWGFGSNGQLGLGWCEDTYEPGTGMMNSTVFLPEKLSKLGNVEQVQCGKTFSTFITNKNEIYACGVNDLHQLGINEPNPKDHLYRKDLLCYDFVWPTQIECLCKMKVKKVACGEGHCLAVVDDILWGWGSNKFGQLGLPKEIKSSIPKPINVLLEYKRCFVDKIACGGFHSMVTMKKRGISSRSNFEEKMKSIVSKFKSI